MMRPFSLIPVSILGENFSTWEVLSSVMSSLLKSWTMRMVLPLIRIPVFFWIKVFKEVKGESGAAEFLPLASFFYKFRAHFPNYSEMIRCCAVGHVPDSWSNLLPKKQQESRKRTVKRTATTTSLQEKQESSGSKDVQTEGHDQAADAVAVCNLKKLLAAQEGEIRRLKDELERLAKNKNMLIV
ncbi:hypothetical protein DM860_004158 [Cuscuta australis]|uniref:Uncharacterized protein n=1 Tax=Cuscuta australis TaxID=267555 RepID=A0A328CW43_9ASTE|nr:hypothetical protein DM860_004158 [Cuscuta australis]